MTTPQESEDASQSEKKPPTAKRDEDQSQHGAFATYLVSCTCIGVGYPLIDIRGYSPTPNLSITFSLPLLPLEPSGLGLPWRL